MKKIFLTVTAMAALTLSTLAQSPESMKYQSVVRDASANVIANQTVGMQFTILQGSITGTSVYQETFTPTTNNYGLVNLELGTGTVVSGTFASIDWSVGPYFTETGLDATGGSTYVVMGTSQLLSVPYALHAKTAGSILNPGADLVNDADSVLGNEYNTSVILNGDSLEVTDGGGTIKTDLSSLYGGPDLVNDPDSVLGNEYNTTVVLNGDSLEVTDGGGTIKTDLSSLIDDADASVTNELNTAVVLNGDSLEVTDGGGTIKTDLSSLINDADASVTNELNTTVVLNGDSLEVTDGGGTIKTDLAPLMVNADTLWTATGANVSNLNTGNVGIGTTTPTQKLDVVGNAEIGTTGEEAFIGNVGFPGYAGFAHKDRANTTDYALIQRTNGQTFLNSSLSQNLLFRQGNVTKMEIMANTGDLLVDGTTLVVDASANRVGVGTITPSQSLDVDGNAEMGTPGEEAFIGDVGFANSTAFAHKTRANTTDYAIAHGNSGTTTINSAVNADLNFRQGNVNKMQIMANTGDVRIDNITLTVDASTDRVGIGTITPSANLDVVGNVKIADGTQGAGRVLTSDAAGNATWTGPVGFKATKAAPQTLPANATHSGYSVEEFDLGNGWDGNSIYYCTSYRIVSIRVRFKCNRCFKFKLYNIFIYTRNRCTKSKYYL